MQNPDGSYTTIDERFIEADPVEIYRTLIDFDHRHLWWHTNQGALLEKGPPEVGKYVALRARQGIFSVHFLMRIQKLEENRLIQLQAEKGPIRGICAWHIEPMKDGAMVRLVWDHVRPSGVLSKLLFWVMGDRKHQAHVSLGLVHLQRYLSNPHRDNGMR